MKRVLRILTRTNRGGPSRQIDALMTRLPEMGWDGPLFAGVPPTAEGDASEALRARGVDVHVVPDLVRAPSPSRDLRALREVTRHARHCAPDVIHTHMAKAGALGRRVGRRLGIPVVHTYHGHHFTTPGWRAGLIRLAERRLARATAGFVALSRTQQREIVQALGAAHAPRVHVIAPGLDIASLRAEAGVTQAPAVRNGTDLLWLGRLVRVKRVDRLLDALARTPSAVRLTLAGDGPLRAALEAMTRARGLSERVRFLGVRDDAPALIAATDVVVLASDQEGTPLALIEAMALGKPVVAPRVGGIAEVVGDGAHGLLVPPGDVDALAQAMGELALSPTRRESMGRAAWDHAERAFGAARLARETADLYDRVIAGPTRDVGSAP